MKAPHEEQPGQAANQPSGAGQPPTVEDAGVVPDPAEVATLAVQRAEAVALLAAAEETVSALLPKPKPLSADDPDLERRAKDLAAATKAAQQARADLDALPPARDIEGVAAAEAAAAAADAARRALVPSRQRMLGSLILGTGLALVVAALERSPALLLVPTGVFLAATFALRRSGRHARDLSARATQLMTMAGAVDMNGLRQIGAATEARRDSEKALAAALARRDSAQAAWGQLAALRAQAPPTPTEPETPEERRSLALARALADEARADLAKVDKALLALARRYDVRVLRAEDVPSTLMAVIAGGDHR